MKDMISLNKCAFLVKDIVDPNTIEEVPYIGLEHIGQGTLHLLNRGASRDVGSTKLRFKKNDILFGKLRPYFRKVIRAPFDGVCSTDIWVVRSKPDYNQNFIFYWMADQKFVDFASAGSDGTKMPRAKWDHASKFQRPNFDYSQQERIADILGALDDKIKLNQQMNQTLENMARAIFKSWFVDFDPVYAKMEGRDYSLPAEVMELFPDELVESEIGLIPKGWRVGKIGEFGEIVTGKTPSTKQSDFYDKKEIPFIKIPDMHGNFFITETLNYLSKKGADSQKNKYLPPNSICVSCIASPGLVVMTTDFSQTNQQINSIVPKDENLSYFVLLSMKFRGEEIIYKGSGGSVITNLNKQDFSNIKILMPDNPIINCLNKYISPIFNKFITNQQQQNFLSHTRDILLPGLINGEIEV